VNLKKYIFSVFVFVVTLGVSVVSGATITIDPWTFTYTDGVTPVQVQVTSGPGVGGAPATTTGKGIFASVNGGAMYDQGVSVVSTSSGTIRFGVIGVLAPSTAGVIYGEFTISTALGSQTASLSPSGGAGSILTGETFHGTASGAQAGNAYNISITSGSGGASINATTGAYTVTAGPAGGIIHYKVWISAGGGYERSADAEANIAVSLSKKIKVTIHANNSSYPITYKLFNGAGVQVGADIVRVAGAPAIIAVVDVGASDGPFTLKSYTQGIMTDGVVFVEDVSGGVEEVISTTIPSSSNPDAIPTNTRPPNTSTANTSTPTAGGATGTVWSATGGAGSDALTNSTFREGVGKVLDQISGEAPNVPDQSEAIDATVSNSQTVSDSVLNTAAVIRKNTEDAAGAIVDIKPVMVNVSGNQLVYSYTLAQIGKTWTLDLTFLQTPITLMRTVIKVLFMLYMWFLYAKTLRSSSV